MVTPAKTESTRRVSNPKPGVRAARKAARPRTGGRSARVVAEVLSATLELFAEQGYAGLSVEAVAVRAGVNKTTIYRRWPAKVDLVRAALFSLRDDEPPPPNTGSLREDLQQVLSRWAARMESPRHRAIAQSFVLGNADADVQALVRQMRKERPAIPHLIFERALKRRELPKGADPQLMSAALLGPLHSRAYWKREPIDQQFIIALVNLVVSGAAAGGAQTR
jgi:AcrR family transcriptional regulator